MLQLIFQDYWPYAIGVAVTVFVGYSLWKGWQEAGDETRELAGLKDKLFTKVYNEEVMRNARTPHSSVVGTVKIDGNSGVELVLEGRDGIFINAPKDDHWHSIPWTRIDRINAESMKRLSVYVKRDDRPPIEVSIPWSKEMSLENWHAFSDQVE